MFLLNLIKNDLQRLTELNKSRFSKIINHAVLCKSIPPCSPTENHNWLEGVRQWHWTSSLWSRGINCRLRSPGWWPERDSAISGTSAFCFWHLEIFYLLFPVHHLLVCNFNCFVDNHPLLSTSSQIWESLDWVHIAATTWQWRAHL